MSDNVKVVVDEPEPSTSSGNTFGSGFFYKKTSTPKRKRSRIQIDVDYGVSDSESDISVDSDSDPEYTLPPSDREGNTSDVTVNVSVTVHDDENGSSRVEGAEATPRHEKRLVEKNGRSVKLNVERWESSIAKSKRNKGEAYVSYRSKKAKEGLKKLGPQCTDGCFEKVTLPKVHDILNAFWELGDYNRQNAYIAGCISEEKFKRKYTKKQTSQRETKTVFKVMHSGVSYSVCRKGFMAMHGVSRDRVELVQKKKKASVTGTPPVDQRGRRPNVMKIVGSRADCMHEHIQNLPVTTSHYSRVKNPHRQYLMATEKAKTIPELYQNYLAWMQVEHEGVPIVRESYYRHIFTTQYNIAFKPPQKDICNTCLNCSIRIEDIQKKGGDITAVKEELELHKEKAVAPKNLLNRHVHQKIPGVRAIAIDLQQTLPYPKLNANKAYYLRKLWMYNFCVYDCESNISHMFLWDETQGGRGADEIGSCVLQWLEEVYDEPFHTLRIFADNCGGQNKNVFIVLMLLQQVHKLRLKRVELIFMVSGHSFLPCDRSFGVIEKTFGKYGTIETPDHYADLMIKAMTNKRIQVHRLTREHFKNIKELSGHITRRTVAGQFKSASQIVLSVNESSSYRLKHHYDLEDSSRDIVVPLEKGRLVAPGRGRGRPKKAPLNLSGVTLKQKYLTDRMLQPAKVKDLRSLLSLMYVKNRTFLEDLITRQEALVSTAPSTVVVQDFEEDSEDEHDATEWEEDLEPVRRVRF